MNGSKTNQSCLQIGIIRKCGSGIPFYTKLALVLVQDSTTVNNSLLIRKKTASYVNCWLIQYLMSVIMVVLFRSGTWFKKFEKQQPSHTHTHSMSLLFKVCYYWLRLH